MAAASGGAAPAAPAGFHDAREFLSPEAFAAPQQQQQQQQRRRQGQGQGQGQGQESGGGGGGGNSAARRRRRRAKARRSDPRGRWAAARSPSAAPDDEEKEEKEARGAATLRELLDGLSLGGGGGGGGEEGRNAAPGSASSDKENGRGRGGGGGGGRVSGYGLASGSASAAADADAASLRRLVRDLPLVLDLGEDFADDRLYREVGEALLRCHLRKRKAGPGPGGGDGFDAGGTGRTGTRTPPTPSADQSWEEDAGGSGGSSGSGGGSGGGGSSGHSSWVDLAQDSDADLDEGTDASVRLQAEMLRRMALGGKGGRGSPGPGGRGGRSVADRMGSLGLESGGSVSPEEEEGSGGGGGATGGGGGGGGGGLRGAAPPPGGGPFASPAPPARPAMAAPATGGSVRDLRSQWEKLTSPPPAPVPPAAFSSRISRDLEAEAGAEAEASDLGNAGRTAPPAVDGQGFPSPPPGGTRTGTGTPPTRGPPTPDTDYDADSLGGRDGDGDGDGDGGAAFLGPGFALTGSPAPGAAPMEEAQAQEQAPPPPFSFSFRSGPGPGGGSSPAFDEALSPQVTTRTKPVAPHTNGKQGKMRRKVAGAAGPGGAQAQAQAQAQAPPAAEAEAAAAAAAPASLDSAGGFSVDLTSKRGKEGGRHVRRGSSRGQRVRQIPAGARAGAGGGAGADGPTSPEDVEMEIAESPSAAAINAAAARVAAEAKAANVDARFMNSFSVGISDSPSSPLKSPRRAGRGKRSQRQNRPSADRDERENAPPESTVLFGAAAAATAAEDLRDEGRQLYGKGRYQESIVKYSTAIAARTNNFTIVPSASQNDNMLAQLFGNRAAALMMVGAFSAAAFDCQRAVGQIRDETLSQVTAQQPSATALQTDSGPPFRSKLLCRMGRALLRAGLLSEAEEAYESTLRTVHAAYENYTQAKYDAKVASILDQSMTDATLGLGEVKRARNSNETMDQVLVRDSSPESYHQSASKHGHRILLHLNEALTISPGSFELHLTKVRVMAAMKRWADLAEHCERLAATHVKLDGIFVADLEAMTLFHSVPYSKYLRADYFDQDGDTQSIPPRTLDAKSVSDAILRLPPEVSPFYLRALRLEERYAEASKAANALESQATLANQSFAWLRVEKAKLHRTMSIKESGDELFRNGHYEKGASKYAECLRIDGEGEIQIPRDRSNAGGRLHAVLHCNRAACWMALKRYPAALKECTMAIHIHSLYMKAMLRRARCYSRLDRHEEAISEYQRWIKLAGEAAAGTTSSSSSSCYFDLPANVTVEDLEKAKKEWKDAKKAKAAKVEAEAGARARSERQKWYEETFRANAGNDGSDAHRRRQRWAESGGKNDARRWDSFNGSSPKKPAGNGASRGHFYTNGSRPGASYQQQSQRQSNRQPAEGNPKGKNHYEILGVSHQANAVEIKKAYRKMALKYHPDKNQNPGAADTFRLAQQAYDTLSDEHARRKHNSDIRYGRT